MGEKTNIITSIYEVSENNYQKIYEDIILDILKNIGYNNYDNKDNNDDMMSIIKQAFMSGKLDSFILNLIEGDKKDIEILDNNANYQFTSSYNQNNEDVYHGTNYQYTTIFNQNTFNYNRINSKIILGQCELILKKHYNISENIPLLIYKIDIYTEGYLTPIVEYEVYDSKNKKQLDLNLCKDMKIKIIHQVEIDENSLFKYDPSSPYYNDICYTYTTENKTDIIIKDRRAEYINNNLSLCESNCEFNGYNNKTKNVECNCPIKIKLPLITEISIDKDKLLKNFVEIKNFTNLNVMKCYSLLFSKEGLIKNAGNYIIISIIFINLILLIVFLLKGYRLLYNKIDLLIENRNRKNENDMGNIEFINNDNNNNVIKKINVFLIIKVLLIYLLKMHI